MTSSLDAPIACSVLVAWSQASWRYISLLRRSWCWVCSVFYCEVSTIVHCTPGSRSGWAKLWPCLWLHNMVIGPIITISWDEHISVAGGVTQHQDQHTHGTAGHEGLIGDFSCMSIFSACFGLPTTVQLPATTWSGQIWISGWILPHFDVRTISVAWKLKKLSNIFWQKIFFLLHPLSNRHCSTVQCTMLMLKTPFTCFKSLLRITHFQNQFDNELVLWKKKAEGASRSCHQKFLSSIVIHLLHVWEWVLYPLMPYPGYQLNVAVSTAAKKEE